MRRSRKMRSSEKLIVMLCGSVFPYSASLPDEKLNRTAKVAAHHCCYSERSHAVTWPSKELCSSSTSNELKLLKLPLLHSNSAVKVQQLCWL